VLNWFKVAWQYEIISDDISTSLFKQYKHASSFHANHIFIKRVILEGLDDGRKATIEDSNKLLRKKNRTNEEEEQMKERSKVITLINRLYNRLGEEVYEQQFFTTSPNKGKR
jgi:hypothetical protein